MKPRVVLADDEICIRQTLAFLLRAEKVDVVGEAADGQQALSLCRQMRPAFLLADLCLPVLDAVGVMLRMRAEKLGIPVMIYTGSEDEQRMIAALGAAPSVMVHKTDALADLLFGIRFAAEGRSYLSPRLAGLHARIKVPKPTDILTSAETELLKMVASGYSTKMAAAQLGNSEHTVSNRREDLMRKLGVHEVTALVRLAIKWGLVDCG